MGRARRQEMEEVYFHCRACGHRFRAAPERVIPVEDQPWHPWEYESGCPSCGEVARQAAWEQNLLHAWAEATGPRTEEGTRRSRFNALKHGLNAQVATFYPARPGGYPHCTTCRFLVSRECEDFGGCLTRTELFLRYHMAYEAKDPGLLRMMDATRQANIAALADDMMLAIIQDGGPRLKSPEWYSDKDGGFHLARYKDEETNETVQLYKIEEHALLKRLFDLLQKNAMSLEDQGMTTKVQEDQGILAGQLADEADAAESMAEYANRQAAALENLAGMINRSQARQSRDPVLIEHVSGEPGPEADADG